MAAILRGLGVGPGDEVVTQAYTCVAVPEGIMAVGATPLFCDIRKNGINMDPGHLAEVITPKTRAVIVQHTFGYPADLAPIARVCDEAGVPLIEDCCHTLESQYNGETVGSFGVAAFYSFEWGKPLACGIGGAITVNRATLQEEIEQAVGEQLDPPIARRLRVALQYAVFRIAYRPSTYWALKDLFGFASRFRLAEGNYNPMNTGEPSPEFAYGMLRSVERRLERQLSVSIAKAERAIAQASLIKDCLQRFDHQPLAERPGDRVVPVRLPLRVSDKQRFLALARQHRVEVAEWYATVVHPLQPDEQRLVAYAAGSCPVAEQSCREIVSFPVVSADDRYLASLATLLKAYNAR